MRFKISFGTKRDRLPIIILDIYLGIVIFLYIFGPVRFHSPYSFFMILYFLLFILVANLMFFKAVRNAHLSNKKADSIQRGRASEPLPIWFQILGLIIPLVMILTSIAITGFSGLTGSLANTMAQSYTFIQSGGTYQQGTDIPMWIYMHFAVFVYLSIVDGIVYWKKINIVRKLMWGATVFSLFGNFVLFKGTQKTLGDIFVLAISAILIKNVLPFFEKAPRRSSKSIIVLALLSIIFACILASIMGERINYLNAMGFDAFRLNDVFWNVDLDSVLLCFFPKSMKTGFACLVFYLCNGLCGLSYCLGSPITWSYGLGSFPDLANILERRFGLAITESTYMYKAYEKFGWHYSEQWHTVFPSLASDWTFIGALIILGIVAYIYGVCWEEILIGENKESLYLFSMINIIWIYLPANNQIFSTRTTGLIFVVCIFMWIRRNRNVSKKWFFYKKR